MFMSNLCKQQGMGVHPHTKIPRPHHQIFGVGVHHLAFEQTGRCRIRPLDAGHGLPSALLRTGWPWNLAQGRPERGEAESRGDEAGATVSVCGASQPAGFASTPGRYAPTTNPLVWGHGRQSMVRRGFTLTEMLVTVAIIGIVGTVAVANYGVAVQRARWDAARAVLLKIYDGEQNYYANVADGRLFPATPVNGASPLADWRNNLNMDIPNNATVTYTIAPVAATFTATVTYVPNGQTQTVTNNRVFGGTWVRP